MERLKEKGPLFETLFASGLYIWIAVHFETLTHIAFAAVLAPFLLIRSEKSDLSSSASFKKLVQILKLDRSKSGQTMTILKIVILAFGSLLIRSYYSLKYIRAGVLQIPNNASRVLLHESIFSNLEFVPETGQISSLISGFFGSKRDSLSSWMLQFIKATIILFFLYLGLVKLIGNWSWSSGSWVFVTPLALYIGMSLFYSGQALAMIFVYFVSMSYRISLKATAIVWLHLVYLSWKAPETDRGSMPHIIEEKHSAVASLFRLIAWASVAFLIFRAFGFPYIYEAWKDTDAMKILSIFALPIGTDPTALHPYHIASGMSGVLVLLTYYFLIDKSSRANDDVITIEKVNRWYPRYYWIRATLSLYTSICTLYFAIKGALILEWPTIAWCPLPWSCS